MPRPLRPLDPNCCPSHRLGAELQAFRLKNNHTQRSLGKKVHVSASLISAIEKGERSVTIETIESCDEELGADGALVTLWKLASTSPRCSGDGPPGARSETRKKASSPLESVLDHVERSLLVQLDRTTLERRGKVVEVRTHRATVIRIERFTMRQPGAQDRSTPEAGFAREAEADGVWVSGVLWRDEGGGGMWRAFETASAELQPAQTKSTEMRPLDLWAAAVAAGGARVFDEHFASVITSRRPNVLAGADACVATLAANKVWLGSRSASELPIGGLIAVNRVMTTIPPDGAGTTLPAVPAPHSGALVGPRRTAKNGSSNRKMRFAITKELVDMPRLSLEAISGTAQERELIREWFVGDAEGARRLEFYATPAPWFSLLGASRHGWFVSVDGQPVGFIDMEVSDDAGYIAYYVAPEFRGQGYGSATVRLLVERAREMGLGLLDGGVDPDNAASIAALQSAGFSIGGLDEEGMLPVTLTL